MVVLLGPYGLTQVYPPPRLRKGMESLIINVVHSRVAAAADPINLLFFFPFCF